MHGTVGKSQSMTYFLFKILRYPIMSMTEANEQNARGREQNAAGGRRIFERRDKPTSEKLET